MMREMGNKKNVKIFSLVIAGVFIASIGGYALMSMGDVANAALSSQYQQKMMETADSMQKDFDEKSKDMSDADKEKLFSTMQDQFNQKRQAIEKGIKDQVNDAVKGVASKKGLSLVVDKSAVIYGGTDITKDVSDALGKTLPAASSSAAAASSAPAAASSSAGK